MIIEANTGEWFQIRFQVRFKVRFEVRFGVRFEVRLFTHSCCLYDREHSLTINRLSHFRLLHWSDHSDFTHFNCSYKSFIFSFSFTLFIINLLYVRLKCAADLCLIFHFVTFHPSANWTHSHKPVHGSEWSFKQTPVSGFKLSLL